MSTTIATGRRMAAPIVTALIVSVVVLTGGFGLVLLLMPQWHARSSASHRRRAPQLLARLFGTALIYVCFLHGWQGHIRSTSALRGVVWANVLQDVLGAVVVSIGVSSGHTQRHGLGAGLGLHRSGGVQCPGASRPPGRVTSGRGGLPWNSSRGHCPGMPSPRRSISKGSAPRRMTSPAPIKSLYRQGPVNRRGVPLCDRGKQPRTCFAASGHHDKDPLP